MPDFLMFASADAVFDFILRHCLPLCWRVCLMAAIVYVFRYATPLRYTLSLDYHFLFSRHLLMTNITTRHVISPPYFSSIAFYATPPRRCRCRYVGIFAMPP